MVCIATFSSHNHPHTQAVAEVCAVCNEANIEVREGRFKAVGNPTEAALLVLAEKLGVPDAQLQAHIKDTRRALVEERGDEDDAGDDRCACARGGEWGGTCVCCLWGGVLASMVLVYAFACQFEQYVLCDVLLCILISLACVQVSKSSVQTSGNTTTSLPSHFSPFTTQFLPFTTHSPLVTGQGSYILNHASIGMVPSGACAYYKQRCVIVDGGCVHVKRVCGRRGFVYV